MRVRENIPRQYRIRKTDFLRIYREYADIEMRHRRLRCVRRDRTPSEQLYTFRPLYTGRRYHSVCKLVGYYKDTGERVERYFTLSHDTLMKRGEIEQKLLEFVKAREGNYLVRWERAVLWEGYRNTNVL